MIYYNVLLKKILSAININHIMRAFETNYFEMTLNYIRKIKLCVCVCMCPRYAVYLMNKIFIFCSLNT